MSKQSCELPVGLPALAKRINAAHVACVNAETDALQHALRAGEGLLAAKRKVGHGNFLLWIRQEFKWSYNTALAGRARCVAAQPLRCVDVPQPPYHRRLGRPRYG